MDVDDGYWDLPQKSLNMFKHVIDNEEFDYVFKCDDDTYVRLDRLHEISNGNDFIGNESLNNENDRYASGGAGYLISRDLLSKLVKEDIPKQGLEDVIFTNLALSHTNKWSVDNRLYYGQGLEDRITCHWMLPRQMVKTHMEKFTKEIDFKIYNISHPCWEDSIRVHLNSGYFERLNHTDSGIFEQKNDVIVLKWYDWSPETFQNDDGVWRLTK